MNISYEVTAGALRDLSRIEGALAEPGLDFVSGSGSVILPDGQTSVAIPVTIIEVKAEEETNPGRSLAQFDLVWNLSEKTISSCFSLLFTVIFQVFLFLFSG